jgi:hypothetical protein
MNTLADVAPAFVDMAHQIVWSSVATVDSKGRPRSRVVHPIWQWDGNELIGWIATRPTPTKRAHLAAHPYMSVSYWSPSHDTCVAECNAIMVFDDATRSQVWDIFLNGPKPVGYDPSIVPGWDTPTSESFAVIQLLPWRLRVFPGTVLLGQGGSVLTWQA